MKRNVLPVLALALCLAFTCEKPTATAAAPQNPVDLTYAAESAVNSVVYIKVTINSKVQTNAVG